MIRLMRVSNRSDQKLIMMEEYVFGRNWEYIDQSYISQLPSTLNIDLILRHTQLIVYAVKC